MGISTLPPGMMMIGLAIALALVPQRFGRLRSSLAILIPIVSGIHMAWSCPEGTVRTCQWLEWSLTPVRADRLTLIWGWVFHLAALLATLYAASERRVLTLSMGLIYAGSAIAAVFAGDLLTLFVFWELTALASAFLVWGGGHANGAVIGTRYLILQVASGVLLLAGMLLAIGTSGSEPSSALSFGQVDQIGVLTDSLNQWPARLVLLAFAIKAAFPLVHTWLPDAYPAASPAGTVFLSVFTTKMAIYALLRGFAGWSPLIGIGCAMALAPLVYAILEDDLRRCLAYCLINQLGFMVAAIGVGSHMAVNGVAAHVVAHIMYKGLLFMAAGAVLYSSGTTRISQLGSLAWVMPWTFVAHLVGVAAISVPLFSGFVTKSISLSALAEAHQQTAWLCLVAATAGVFWVCGPRLTYQVFLRPPPADFPSQSLANTPLTMRAAMATAAAGCLLVGCFPTALYRYLPFPIDYRPYTFPHVLMQMELILASTAAFVILQRFGMLPNRRAIPVRDVDRLYRGPLLTASWVTVESVERVVGAAMDWACWLVFAACQQIDRRFGDDGERGPMAATGEMAMWAAVMLIVYLLVYFR